MLKQNRYSTIRGEPPNKAAHTLTGFYDLSTKPATLFGVLAGIVALLSNSLVANVPKAAEGDPEALVFIALVALAVVVDYRVMQSLFLAKRDYSSLDSGFGDILIFAAVAFCFVGLTLLLRQQWTLRVVTVGPRASHGIAPPLDYGFRRRTSGGPDDESAA